MSAQIIDGKYLAAGIREKTTLRVAALREQGRAVSVAGLLIGADAAAQSYADSQIRHAASVGIDYQLIELAADTSESAAVEAIGRLNAEATVSGIMLFLPLPKTLDPQVLQQAIAPQKDVEGVGAANLGLLAMGREASPPCTAAAAFECLKSTGMKIEGRNAVVVGRSAIVGKPLAMLLLNSNATVTTCHSRTPDLPAHTRRAEILCVCAGVPGLIGAEHVSNGAIVIDVGTNRVLATDACGETKTTTVGDVRFEEVAPIARAVTPVPGGVGPVTVAMLLANSVSAAERAAPRTV